MIVTQKTSYKLYNTLPIINFAWSAHCPGVAANLYTLTCTVQTYNIHKLAKHIYLALLMEETAWQHNRGYYPGVSPLVMLPYV